jgi:preprotein translocase subunit SecG
MSQQPPPPAYGYPQQPRPQSSSDAVVALVLAIGSWVVCPVVLAIVALVFASKAKRTIEASNGWVEGSGMVTAAKIIAWINIILGILGLVFFVIALIVAAANTDTTTFTDTTDAVMALF